jgi:two-component system, NarL family, response regulator NreC
MPSSPPAQDATETITIVLADDHSVVRSGLRMLLEAEPGIEVLAEAGDVNAARRYTLGHKPRVLVLDLHMPGGSSLEAIPAIALASPDTSVVILTMQEDPAFAREALRAGARGYVPKHVAGTELVQAIRTVAGGGTWLNPALGARMAASLDGPVGELAELSEREVEVLRLIALGHTNREIAQQLSLSIRTIESHRAHVQQKLGASTRSMLVRYALDHDVIGSHG